MHSYESFSPITAINRVLSWDFCPPIRKPPTTTWQLTAQPPNLHTHLSTLLSSWWPLKCKLLCVVLLCPVLFMCKLLIQKNLTTCPFCSVQHNPESTQVIPSCETNFMCNFRKSSKLVCIGRHVRSGVFIKIFN